MKTNRLRVRLHEVTPVVLRVIDVPDGMTLAELHPVLQAALGWTDSHLHEYTAGARRYGESGPDVPAGSIDDPDERRVSRQIQSAAALVARRSFGI